MTESEAARRVAPLLARALARLVAVDVAAPRPAPTGRSSTRVGCSGDTALPVGGDVQGDQQQPKVPGARPGDATSPTARPAGHPSP